MAGRQPGRIEQVTRAVSCIMVHGASNEGNCCVTASQGASTLPARQMNFESRGCSICRGGGVRII